jgi:hypothetical protein
MVNILEESKEQRLWSLVNTMDMKFSRLFAQANKAEALAHIDELGLSSVTYEAGLKALREIEDCIKRFNENRPQEYEE